MVVYKMVFFFSLLRSCVYKVVWELKLKSSKFFWGEVGYINFFFLFRLDRLEELVFIGVSKNSLNVNKFFEVKCELIW